MLMEGDSQMRTCFSSTARRGLRVLGVVALGLGGAAAIGPAASALSLTDAAIFSSNNVGQAYNGLIWNTVGSPPDLANRWNAYFSSSTDINSPVFLNDGNDAAASIDIALAPGIHGFGIYGEAAGNHQDHFTLSLYFDNGTDQPQISAVAPVGGGAGDFAAASHADGLGLLQSDGFVPNANALTYFVDDFAVTLTSFFWSTDTANHPDLVWPHNQRHQFGPSPNGNDFYGQITLQVEQIPEPSALGLLALALLGLFGLGAARRRRMT